MPRVCDITGKRTTSGMNVSHSNAHTFRTFKPNLHEKTFQSDILGRTVSLRLSARAIRTLDKHNGLDGFMVQVKNRRIVEDFSPTAVKLHKEIMAKLGDKAPALVKKKVRQSAPKRKSGVKAKKA